MDGGQRVSYLRSRERRELTSRKTSYFPSTFFAGTETKDFGVYLVLPKTSSFQKGSPSSSLKRIEVLPVLIPPQRRLGK